MALSPAQQQMLLQQQQQVAAYNSQKNTLMDTLSAAMPQKQVSAQISPTQYQMTTIPGDISVPDSYNNRPYYANANYARDLANGLAPMPTGMGQSLTDQLTAFRGLQKPDFSVPGVARPHLALRAMAGTPNHADLANLGDNGYGAYAGLPKPHPVGTTSPSTPATPAVPGVAAVPSANNIHNLTSNATGGASPISRTDWTPLAQRQAAGQLPQAPTALANALSPGITNTVQQAQRQKTSINPAYAATAGIK